MLSYPNVLTVIPHLSYSKRMEASKISVEFRKYHQRFSFSLTSIRFSQKYGPVNNNGDPEEVGTGNLHVESIIYDFTFDPLTNQVQISNTLTPGRIITSNDITIARRYLQYYLRSSKRPVEHVHIVETDRPFRNMHDLRIPSLTWHLNGSRADNIFDDFPRNYVFEKLELIDCFGVHLGEPLVHRAKHLIVKNIPIYQEFVVGTEPLFIAGFYMLLRNKVEIFLGLNHVRSFVNLSYGICQDSFHIGSSFTGIFMPNSFLKDYMWEYLLRAEDIVRPNGLIASRGYIKGRECVVLKTTNDWIAVVFHNYVDTGDKESFTTLKLKREMDAELDE
ncbi:hypothetical protein B9Z55_002431 [Caenorhabditis nigoni]|uniref:F-box associated domain-containing protein n=1 Tax=Caenorhabditis nigoni TaxID=1611254 RepID=A0A2G5VKF0_9PELO|nr:hypothetical protein B9Z55_002431 [Caenorhabditis nigoni]